MDPLFTDILNVFFLFFFNITDDEAGGGNEKHLPTKTRKSSQSDLYMRLGLLLGSNNVRATANIIDTVDGSGVSHSASSNGPCQQRIQSAGHETSSYGSLLSFDQQTLASTNTSPVSTLTGTSSEAEVVAAALRNPMKNKDKIKFKGKRDCDSASSLASISTSMSMSMSVSVSGLSNASSSPLTSRKNNIIDPTSDFEYGTKNRRSCVRKSTRGNIKSGDVNLRFIAQQQQQQLMLKPLFFEVPLVEVDPLFTGRQWLLQEIDQVIKGSSYGALISGSPGTGKTALILQLVEHSCFGRRSEHNKALHSDDIEEADEDAIVNHQSSSTTISGFEINIKKTNEKIREIAGHVVAYHFCQVDNNSTCLVPDLIHSLAAQLCQAPQLIAYREYLLSEAHLQGSLSPRECTVDPDLALSRGIIEPMQSLRRAGKLGEVNMIILIDAVCEAEYHRPDRGDTIASFLTRHAPNFPSWLKIICTVRTELGECAKQFPYTRISLDKSKTAATNDISSSNITRDLLDYINYRLIKSPAIQTNVTASINNGKESSCGANQTRFSSHLLASAGASFLFVKLTLDLIEKGHLVAKSASYKVKLFIYF